MRGGWVVNEMALTRAGVRVVVQMSRSCSGQVSWGLYTGSGDQEQEGVVQPTNGQEGVSGDYRQVGTCKWTGGSAGDGRRGMGGVDWANSGGHRLGEGGEGQIRPSNWYT